MSEEETIQIEVTEENANKLVDSMKDELNRIENTLNSYRSNNIATKASYDKLLNEKSELEKEIDEIEETIDEQTKDGLENLFG